MCARPRLEAWVLHFPGVGVLCFLQVAQLVWVAQVTVKVIAGCCGRHPPGVKGVEVSVPDTFTHDGSCQQHACMIAVKSSGGGAY